MPKQQWLMSTHSCVQYVLLLLVMAVNSDWFQTLQSYMLLLKPPVLMHSWLGCNLTFVAIDLMQWLMYGQTTILSGKKERFQ